MCISSENAYSAFLAISWALDARARSARSRYIAWAFGKFDGERAPAVFLFSEKIFAREPRGLGGIMSPPLFFLLIHILPRFSYCRRRCVRQYYMRPARNLNDNGPFG